MSQKFVSKNDQIETSFLKKLQKYIQMNSKRFKIEHNVIENVAFDR